MRLFVGYDVGSFVAQTVARTRPDLVKALVVSPPLPGAAERVLGLRSFEEFWYTSFHRLTLAEEIVDGPLAQYRVVFRVGSSQRHQPITDNNG